MMLHPEAEKFLTFMGIESRNLTVLGNAVAACAIPPCYILIKFFVCQMAHAWVGPPASIKTKKVV